MNAVAASCSHIEKALGKSTAFRKVEDRLYVVKQGSSYVMISVIPTGPKSGQTDKAVVRVVSQVVSGVNPEPSLFRQLLILNGQLRFGAFAFVPEGNLILFTHSILGGTQMDEREVVATVHDVAWWRTSTTIASWPATAARVCRTSSSSRRSPTSSAAATPNWSTKDNRFTTHCINIAVGAPGVVPTRP